MDSGRRKTHQFRFKSPDVAELRKLGKLVVCADKFRGRYGRLLTMLNTDPAEGVLNTLIQFYDPPYRCFTFPDYQLAPTLEEYAYIMGIPISDQVPFSGLEDIPKPQVIADSVHLKKEDIEANLDAKGGIRGLSAKFLMEKAATLAKEGSMVAFEAVLALLIYGIVLFPNIDNFVDVNAIRIFMIGNPIPTLLADTYYSMHLRTEKKGGTVMCCAPLLYKWFISHLPQSPVFKDNKNGLRWSQRIMALTNEDIDWYSRVYDGVRIIVSCGEFRNVPLLGTKGGINYNPILARRQLGYPMRDKPHNLLVESLFIQEGVDSNGLKERMARAWRSIHKEGRNELGQRGCVALEPYTQWVKERAAQIKMPYPPEEPMFPKVVQIVPTPEENIRRLQTSLVQVEKERDSWKSKYLELQKQMQEKDELLRRKDELIEQHSLKRRAEHEARTIVWKGVADKIVVEKAEMKTTFEAEIRRLKRKLSQKEGSSSKAPVFP